MCIYYKSWGSVRELRTAQFIWETSFYRWSLGGLCQGDGGMSFFHFLYMSQYGTIP